MWCYHEYEEQLWAMPKLQDIRASHLPTLSICLLSGVTKGATVEHHQLQSGVFQNRLRFFRQTSSYKNRSGSLNMFKLVLRRKLVLRKCSQAGIQHCSTWGAMQRWGPRLVCRWHRRWMCVASAFLTELVYWMCYCSQRKKGRIKWMCANQT